MPLISTQRVYAMDIWTKVTEIMEDTSSSIPAAVTGLLVFADYTCRCDKKKDIGEGTEYKANKKPQPQQLRLLRS